MSRPSYVLKASCTDTVGIVAAVTGFLAARGALITEMAHFVDDEAQKSFIRVEFEDDAESGEDLGEMSASFKSTVSKTFGMRFAFHPSGRKMRTLIAVSKQSHCINALLHRWWDGHLPIEITGIVSNHEEQRDLASWYELPFHHFPIESGKKPAQEARILALFEETGSELLVLARYMQILSPHLCESLAGRTINIHHSFLPAFAGAKPYHAAFERGVKIIGATSHYVTEELDEGPIIAQDVTPVSHIHSIADFIAKGRDLEKMVLARAVRRVRRSGYVETISLWGG